MTKWITRQEAADMLGRTTQTISNYIEKGLLAGKSVGRTTYVDKDSIQKFLTPLNEVGQLENKINYIQSELSKERDKLESTLEDVRRANGLIKAVGGITISRDLLISVCKMAENCQVITARERAIMVSVISERYVEGIVHTYGLTRSRIAQICAAGCRKISKMADYPSLKDELSKKESEIVMRDNIIAQQDEELERLRYLLNIKEQSGEDCDRSKVELLMTKVTDLPFTVRTLNCLKAADVSIVADLCRLHKMDLLKFRNFGKKSITELDDFMADNNLQWGMDVTPIVKIAKEQISVK